MKFYKILGEDERCHGVQFCDGWNEDSVHGIYFAGKHILALLGDGPWIREVKEYDNKISKYPGPPEKFKSPRVFLGPRAEITPDVIRELVADGADVHADNDSALRWASMEGRLDIVQCLIECGADVHARNDSALCTAAANGHLNVVRCLVEHGADIHADNDSALRWATLYGHLGVVQYLVEHGADVNVDNGCILRFASRNGHLGIVQYLTERGIAV